MILALVLACTESDDAVPDDDTAAPLADEAARAGSTSSCRRNGPRGAGRSRASQPRNTTTSLTRSG